MKSYKIIEFDRPQNRVFVEVTLNDGELQVHHLPVTYQYLERFTEGEDGPQRERLVDATPEQFKQEIENTIKQYEADWDAYEAPTAVPSELNKLLEK